MKSMYKYYPLLVVAAVTFTTGCTTMQRHWKHVESVNTIVAYEQFLQQYPQGRLAHKARTKIERKHLQKVEGINTTEAYEEFLRLYPRGELSNKARAKLEALYIEETRKKNYAQFLAQYPQEKLAHMARVGVEAMYLWRAKDTNTIEAYEDFLNLYPHGELSNKARAKLEILYFEKAKEKNTIAAYEEFLRLYPHGELSDEARVKLQTLDIKKAKVKESIPVREQLVAKSPNGQLVFDARNSINELKFDRIEIVLLIHNLYHADGDEGREEVKEVDQWLKRYVENLLLPKLTNQGFTVKYLGAHVSPKQGRQAILTIDYAETVGGWYGFFGRDDFQGINISCILRLIHPITGKVVWEDRLIASNSFSTCIFGNPHKNALENLESEFKRIDINLDKWAQR